MAVCVCADFDQAQYIAALQRHDERDLSNNYIGINVKCKHATFQELKCVFRIL